MTKEEAVYILRNTAWLGGNECVQKVEEAIDTLEQVNPKWIPVSDGVPFAEYGESKPVLATCGHRDGEDTSFRWIKTLYFNGGCWCYPTGETYEQKVYAYMPLPEPYKEKEE